MRRRCDRCDVCRFVFREARQEDAELVTTQPGDLCLVAKFLAQPCRDLDQCIVSDGMAKRVIDLLEAIHVN